MTTQARELAKLVTNAGDVNLGDDISLASDGAILNFGADSDVTLTHVADTGLLLNSSRQIQFGDSGTHIRQSADGVLQLTSDTEVEINATTVDINANVDISGNLVLGGNITIGDADSDDISFGGELTSHIVPNADDTYDLGSSTKQWRNLYVDGSAFIDTIDGTDETTITNTDTGSSAGPIVSLYRNSSSAADADYLGQFKFQGENDADQQVNYAKITGKILDASDGNEDGILEFAHIKAGSQTITGRWRSDSLQLLNGTTLVADSGVQIDNITIDGTEIDLSSGDLTLDVAGDIILDADGGTISLKDGGTQFGFLAKGSSDKLSIKAIIQDADIGFFGNDGGSEVTALTLDMSDAGTAIFNNTIKVSADSDVVAEIGRAHVGGGLSGLSDYAIFSHLHAADSGGYALAQNASGATFLNADDGQKIFFLSHGTSKMAMKSDGKFGIGTNDPDNLLTIQGASYDQIRIGSNQTDNTNKTAGIVSTTYTNQSVSLFQMFNQNGNNALYYGSADGAHRGLQNHYFYTNSNYNSTSGHTKMFEINYFGQIKSGSGGMVLQTKESYNSTAQSVGSGGSVIVNSTTITVKEDSKIAVWFHSGQVQNDGNSQNPNGHIQWVNSGGTSTNITDHNGNHYGWDASTHVERMFFMAQGISGALSAGTYTVRFVGSAYGGTVTWNYQGQGSHMIIQEISAG